MSFNPGEDAEMPKRGTAAGDDDEPTPSPRPSRLGLSNAAQSILNRGEGQDHDRVRDKDGERPTYSKAYLDELRNSTPTTPRDLSTRASPSLDLVDTSVASNTALDLESKFGKTTLSSSTSSSHIPSAAEIREKKERRARLAKEQAANAATSTGDNGGADFISLEDYDSDGEFKPRRMQVGMYSAAPPREKDTRLIHDDEDIAEGFDEFVDDPGRVALSRKGQRNQTLREREAMRALIDEAEGSAASSDEGGDSDSDYERHRHYETAQTHRGMDGLSSHATHTRQANRPRQPRETTAIPKLSAGLTRLRDMVSHLEFERARIEKRRADIARERTDIKQSQAHIQTSLEEAGQELERVTKEHNLGSSSAQSQGPGHDLTQPTNGSSSTAERGLESLGSTV